MRVEIGDHAFDGGIDQFAVVDGADIVGAHPLEGVAEQVELAIGAHVVGAMRGGQQPERRNKTDDHAEADECKLLHDLFAFLRSRPSRFMGLPARPF